MLIVASSWARVKLHGQTVILTRFCSLRRILSSPRDPAAEPDHPCPLKVVIRESIDTSGRDIYAKET